MTRVRPRLAFVSPLFLYPLDSGGKIRTTNILRGLKGRAFDITLLCPVTAAQRVQWATQIPDLCDDFQPWTAPPALPRWRRGLDLWADVPVNVAADRTAPALAAVRMLAARQDIDLIVFDFVHASVLRPVGMHARSVCFTHNVEAEIFARHAARAPDPVRRWMWTSQHAKMVDFEARALAAFDKVIAVSERDAQHFAQAYGVRGAEAIPTGVDLEHFAWAAPPDVAPESPPTVVFTGSMDAPANIDGVLFFLQQVWPRVVAACPEARFIVVGRRPPESLVAQAQRMMNVQFTGFVDDVRPYIRRSHVSVIPLLVGGGTRIKAFEAMALGSPVVSTSIGIEGLDVEADQHFLRQDDAAGFADAVVQLLRDGGARLRLSRHARDLVERRFGHQVAAAAFEDICLRTLDTKRSPGSTRIQAEALTV